MALNIDFNFLSQACQKLNRQSDANQFFSCDTCCSDTVVTFSLMLPGARCAAVYGAVQYAVPHGYKAPYIFRNACNCGTRQTAVSFLTAQRQSEFEVKQEGPANLERWYIRVYSLLFKRCGCRLIGLAELCLSLRGSLLDRQNTGNAAKAVGETVQFFITTMDSLKLNMVAVDQLYPLLNDLMQSLNKAKLPTEIFPLLPKRWAFWHLTVPTCLLLTGRYSMT